MALVFLEETRCLYATVAHHIHINYLLSACISSSVIELVLFLTWDSSFLTCRLYVIFMSPVGFSIDIEGVIQSAVKASATDVLLGNWV